MSTATATLYETDFYGWIQRQVDALKTGNLEALDVDNLIEEVEDMGRSEKRELDRQLEVLLMHLLKWQYQPHFRGRSWQFTVMEQRTRISYHLADNPSLKNRIPETYERTYALAVMDAVKETGLDKTAFPAQCPWTFEEVMDEGFWPESPATGAVADSC